MNSNHLQGKPDKGPAAIAQHIKITISEKTLPAFVRSCIGSWSTTPSAKSGVVSVLPIRIK
jgi:hypothetical protein